MNSELTRFKATVSGIRRIVGWSAETNADEEVEGWSGGKILPALESRSSKLE
jgi:hypothetical protein